jgi:glycosyltransferase involved in cell wall biosynthesis
MVSIIIPCYNYGHLIAQSIESILTQTYTDIEVIVINDGSTDNTEDVVKAYAEKDNRIKYYKYANAGLGTSRNRGIKHATGAYIQFLDADDVLENRKFEVQLQIFKNNPTAGVVYSSVRYFKNDPYNVADRLITYWGTDKEWMPKISGNGFAIAERAFTGNFSHLSSALFKREIVDAVGDFDNDLSAVADYHFLLRCVIANAAFFYHDTPGTYSLVRWHVSNMSGNVKMMQAEEQRMRIKINDSLTALPQAMYANENAIKSLGYKLTNSWKRHLLSGGKFDVLKKIAQQLRLDKLLLYIFYK